MLIISLGVDGEGAFRLKEDRSSLVLIGFWFLVIGTVCTKNPKKKKKKGKKKRSMFMMDRGGALGH